MIRISGRLTKFEKSSYGENWRATVESQEHENDFGFVKYFVDVPEAATQRFMDAFKVGEVVDVPVVFSASESKGKVYLNCRVLPKHIKVGEKKLRAAGGGGL